MEGPEANQVPFDILDSLVDKHDIDITGLKWSVSHCSWHTFPHSPFDALSFKPCPVRRTRPAAQAPALFDSLSFKRFRSDFCPPDSSFVVTNAFVDRHLLAFAVDSFWMLTFVGICF